MKIIDARSGEIMTPGKNVSYGDSEKMTLIDVDEGLISARALVETTYRDYGAADRRLVTARQWVPLAVRFMHSSPVLPVPAARRLHPELITSRTWTAA